MSDDELVALKNRAVTQFLSIPGVTGVGLGGRERGGRPTGEVVLKVFVARKRPAGELTPGELLPAQFEGVGVDVVEMDEPVLLDGDPDVDLGTQPGSPATSQTDIDDAEVRPLRGGSEVQVSLGGAGFGTLGCFLTDPADAAKVYALTNYHVVVSAQGSTPVALSTTFGQPDNQSGPTKCCNHLIGKFAAGSLDTIRDAAAVLLDPGTRWLAEITEIGAVAGTHTLTLAEVTPLTYQVRKRGCRTLHTGGIVHAINFTSTGEHPVTHQPITRTNVVVVQPNPNAGVRAGQDLYFADHGDSGSVIVNASNEVVALLYGRPQTGPVFNGLGLPIADILARFQSQDGLTLQVATAADVGQVNTVPGPPAPLTVLRPALVRTMAVSVAEPSTPELSTPEPSSPEPATTMSRIGRDLGASSAGRALRALWVEHGTEVLELINTRRRVTLAWHRDGGPALTQSFLRAATDPAARIPASTGGEPPLARLARIQAVLHANASPPLRQALHEALVALPDPGGRTYAQFLSALADADHRGS